MFVPEISAVRTDGIDSKGIDTSRLALLADPVFAGRISRLIGQPVTFDLLNEISREVVRFGRERGHPFLTVTIPPQNVSTGSIQFVVTEFTIGKLAVEGNRWFAAHTIRDGVRLAPGDVVDTVRLGDEIDQLNQNPFRQVSAVYRPGDRAGTTDLILQTQDRFPLHVYTALDNSGTTATGLYRWGLGIGWGNAFGLGDQASFQYQTSTDFFDHNTTQEGVSLPPAFRGYSGTYAAALHGGQSLEFIGAYQQQVPLLGASLGQQGTSEEISIRYRLPLPRLFGLKQSLALAYDFKSSNNNLSFGGSQVFNSTTQINEFPVIYTIGEADRWGDTSISNNLVLSPGGLSALNTNTTFEQNMPGARARYMYDRLDITRTTPLPRGLSAVTTASAQLNNRNLLASEQLCAGGIDTIPGYQFCTVSGSRGVVFRQELRFPAFSPGELMGLGDGLDQLQLDAFFGYALVANHPPNAGQQRSQQLQSIGAGGRYAAGRFVSLELQYGFQLKKAPESNSLGQFANFSVLIGF